MEIRCKGFRVYLKTLGIDDADDFAALVNDPDILMRLSNDKPIPYQRENALGSIERATMHLMDGTGYAFTIRLEENGKMIGRIDYRELSKIDRHANIGYWLGKEYWGRGYAKEAIRLMLWFGFKKVKLHRVHAYVYDTNEPSLKVLGSLGFVKEGTLRDNSFNNRRFLNDVLFGILENEHKDMINPEVVE